MSNLNFKKYFIMIAFWAIGISATVGASIYLQSQEGVPYEEVAVPFVKKAVTEISEWDVAKTKGLMAPEILATIPDDKFARAIDFFSQLGALKSMDEPSFQKAFIDQETEHGKFTILEYNVDTVYEQGPAQVNLKLLKRDESYQIYRFNFAAETLMPEAAKKDS